VAIHIRAAWDNFNPYKARFRAEECREEYGSSVIFGWRFLKFFKRFAKVFVDRPVGLLAFYRAVSGRIAAGALFGVGSVADSTGVGRV
jgi:hypothetical protein